MVTPAREVTVISTNGATGELVALTIREWRS
jgi:hypothetical protein